MKSDLYFLCNIDEGDRGRPDLLQELRGDSESAHKTQSLELSRNQTTSEIASLPRYLSAANVLDADIRLKCTSLLQREAEEPMARAGYDAFDDTIRAMSLSLLEVLTPSFSP